MYLEDDGMPVKWSLLKVWPTPSSPFLQIPLDLTQKFSAFVMRLSDPESNLAFCQSWGHLESGRIVLFQEPSRWFCFGES